MISRIGNSKNFPKLTKDFTHIYLNVLCRKETNGSISLIHLNTLINQIKNLKSHYNIHIFTPFL